MELETSRSSKFQFKNNRKFISVPGTKIISLKDQILISSGVISLDSLIGGGLQVGSIFLIEEDEFGVFSKYLIKYFLAEGMACKHSLFINSLDCDVHQLARELPVPINYSEGKSHSSDVFGSADDLKIAWRYQDNPQVQSAPTSSGGAVFGHNFDLTCPYSNEAIDNADIFYWPQNWPPPLKDSIDPYKTLLQELSHRVQNQGHSMKAAQPRRTILRVVIDRLGSPMWKDSDERIPHFIYNLRKIIHSSFATVVITIPPSFVEQVTLEECEHMSDNVIKLQSLANNANPMYGEYNGLLTVVKLATLNTLATHIPDTQDWAFKLRKKRFVVEKLHLPPELQDSTQREQDEDSKLTCASSISPALDF